MRTKKGIKELITGIIIGEGLKMTDLEENAVDRIIEALTEENNLFIPDVSIMLPSADKLYKMAGTIVDRQEQMFNVVDRKTIDWEDLKNDWFDWLDTEIKGN